MTLRAWFGLSALCAAIASCSASGNAPQLPPVGTLGPRPAAPPMSALSVVYAGPRGEAALGSSVQL